MLKVFMAHFCLRGMAFFSSSEERVDIKPQLLLESSNFLQSVALQICNFEQLGILLGDQLVAKSIGYILYRLWELARSGEVEHLNVSILIKDSENFLEMLQSPPAGFDQRSDDAIISFASVGLALTDHFIVQDLSKAIQLAESCTKFMLASPEPWRDREANVFRAFSLSLKASGQLRQSKTLTHEHAEKACQYAFEALAVLEAMESQPAKFDGVRMHSYLEATSILKHMACFSTSFCNRVDEFGGKYDAALKKVEPSIGKDSTGFGAPMALKRQLARRDWWFKKLGVRQTNTYGDWIMDNEGDSGGSDTESTRLLSKLRLAMSNGDKVAEFQLHDALIDYYERTKNWKTAAEHVRELHRLATAAAAAGQDNVRSTFQASTTSITDCAMDVYSLKRRTLAKLREYMTRS